MKKFHLKSKKSKILTVSVVIVAIFFICMGLNFTLNNKAADKKAITTTKSNVTTTIHTTDKNTVSSAETATKADETTKNQTAKSTTQKNSSSQKQSGSSDSLKSNGRSQKQTTKKSTTTTKKETTTKTKSYAMTASEIRNYAFNEIAKIDGTIYVPEATKENSGWYTPLIIEPGDSEEYIKEGIRDSINFVYNGTTKNGYNVYVENTTYWHATISSSGEMKEYNTPCIKVYFLYGQAWDPDTEL